MIDLLVIETGNGGDAVFKGSDFITTEGLHNMPYIGMFGGNPGFLTDPIVEDNQFNFDWWGNFLLHPNDQQVWINSRLENLLNTIALTSENRNLIIETVKQDLDFMSEFAGIEIDVVYVNVDRIKIIIKATQPDNLTQEIFVFLWNATQNELVEDGIYVSDPEGTGVGLNNLLNFDL